MKKGTVLVLVAVFSLMITGVAFAAEEKKPAVPTGIPVQGSPAMDRPARPMNPMFNAISGKISKIDTADPANVKIEVTDSASNAPRTLTVMPWTNINKISSISELKVGDEVRVMARKVENNDVAMGIIFGDLKKLPMPRPMGTPPGMAMTKPTSPVTKPGADSKKK